MIYVKNYCKWLYDNNKCMNDKTPKSWFGLGPRYCTHNPNINCLTKKDKLFQRPIAPPPPGSPKK